MQGYMHQCSIPTNALNEKIFMLGKSIFNFFIDGLSKTGLTVSSGVSQLYSNTPIQALAVLINNDQLK